MKDMVNISKLLSVCKDLLEEIEKVYKYTNKKKSLKLLESVKTNIELIEERKYNLSDYEKKEYEKIKSKYEQLYDELHDIVRTTLRLRKSLYEEIKKIAEKENTTITKLVEEGLKCVLERRKITSL